MRSLNLSQSEAVVDLDDKDDLEGSLENHDELQACRDRGPLSPTHYPFIDLYPDPTYQGPTYIYTPPSWTTNRFQIQLYRATLPGGIGPSAFDFYSNGMSQYLYIPYVQITTSSPNSTPTTVSTNIQTIGVASIGPPPTLNPAPLYYPTFSVWPAPTVFPTLAVRVTTLQAGSNTPPTQFIPQSAVVDYLTTGQEVTLRLNGIPGRTTPACYVWRKIFSNCPPSTTCPAGYACGPEDLFLQFNS